MYLPTELVHHIIFFYVLSSRSSSTPTTTLRASISPLTLSSHLIRSFTLQTYYTTLSIPLSLSAPSDWTPLLSSRHLPIRIHSLTLTNSESFLPLLHTLPALRVLSLPPIIECPSSTPLLERLTWIPTSICELSICVRRKACGTGAVWDMIGARLFLLEKFEVKFESEKGAGAGRVKEEVLEEIVIQLGSSSLLFLPKLNELSISLPGFTIPYPPKGEPSGEGLHTLTHANLFHNSNSLSLVTWKFNDTEEISIPRSRK